MYLERLHLRGFRSAADTAIALRPDVSVVVGENNAGKSNVMDAIRLLTLALDGKGGGPFPGRDDLHRDGCAEDAHVEGCRKSIELSARYRSTAPGDLDRLSQAFDEDGETASFHLTITPPATGFRRPALSWRAGSGATTDLDPEPGARESIRHLYLPPLRDAQRDLASSSGGRIQLVVERLLHDEQARETFLGEVGRQFEAIEIIEPLPQAIKAVRERLTRLTEGAHPQTAGLGFADASVGSIARGLRLRMEQAGLDPRDLAESGLGYANLLYMATVLTQLQDAAEADLTLLLVEEPEAHLHPQLQTFATPCCGSPRSPPHETGGAPRPGHRRSEGRGRCRPASPHRSGHRPGECDQLAGLPRCGQDPYRRRTPPQPAGATSPGAGRAVLHQGGRRRGQKAVCAGRTPGARAVPPLHRYLRHLRLAPPRPALLAAEPREDLASARILVRSPRGSP
ncbi:AAA family ATPase [Streptomyces chartreusis]|uniref:AAA family ATPase n=1 Tax=Streptomyces chartreusis TaxID=1969 RepID=A0A7H8TIG7_STRCX|nr:AAA family ATPase [Streptomyces chartreusis]